MGIMDLLKRKKPNAEDVDRQQFDQETQQTPLGDERTNAVDIDSQESGQAQRVALSDKKMLTCRKCNASFKLVDSIPVKDNKIHCTKCKNLIQISNIHLPDNTPDLNLAAGAQIDVLREKEHFAEMYQHIERYYKSKNEMYQFAISLVCEGKKRGFRYDHDLQKEIDRLIWCISDSEADLKKGEKRRFEEGSLHTDSDLHDSIKRFKNMIKFHEDIRTFCRYFATKGITSTYNDILEIFRDVKTKVIERSNQQYERELLQAIKERVAERITVDEITREFMKYKIEIGGM